MATRPHPRRNAPQELSALASWFSRENIESVVWAVAVALIIRTFIIAPFKIPSGSMRTTLLEGDRILVSKFTYWFTPPARGDIIVFRYPDNPTRPFIKRLAAAGGDTIAINKGQALVNGLPSTSPAIRETYYYNAGSFGDNGREITVPADSYFVLGDNSASSHDSRFWGFVSRKLLIGKAVCIFWPPHRIRALR